MSVLQLVGKMSTETAKAEINGKEVQFQYNYTEVAPEVTVVNFQCQDVTTGNTITGAVTPVGQVSINGILPNYDLELIPEILKLAKQIIDDSKAKANPTLLPETEKAKGNPTLSDNKK